MKNNHTRTNGKKVVTWHNLVDSTQEADSPLRFEEGRKQGQRFRVDSIQTTNLAYILPQHNSLHLPLLLLPISHLFPPLPLLSIPKFLSSIIFEQYLPPLHPLAPICCPTSPPDHHMDAYLRQQDHHADLHGFPFSPGAIDRFPQWSHVETRELVSARAELDAAFMETKRNRPLWDLVSSKMMEKGFSRSAEQCKCKWKNLVTRYKGTEVMDPESARQFPFREELRAIFDARMQRLMWLAAARGQDQENKKKNKSKKSARCLISEDDEFMEQNKNKIANSAKKRKIMQGEGGSSDGVVEMLEELLRRQGRMEMEWCKEEEAREAERTAREADWRRVVETLERERMAAEQRWREEEERRRDREEAMAERRDALITALINSLLQYGVGLP